MTMHCTPKEKPDEAFEVINFFNCSVYVADNRNSQVTRKDFINWKPSNLWQRNPGGIRYLTFDESCIFSSPGYNTLHRHHISAGEPWRGVPWIYLANGCPGEHGLGGCFPESCNFLMPKDGSLKWSEISKCHYMKWHAKKAVTLLNSPDGDQFILHATSNLESARAGKINGTPRYPVGWFVTTRILDSDFLLRPEPNDSLSSVIPNGRIPFGNYSCGYVIVTDSAGNSFHRITNAAGLPSTFQLDLFGEVILFGISHPWFVISVLVGSVIIVVITIRKFLKRVWKSKDKSY